MTAPLIVGTGIQILKEILTANAVVVKVQAEALERRELNDHETKKLLIASADQRAKQARSMLADMNKSFGETVLMMQNAAEAKDRELQSQLANMIKEHNNEKKELATASLEERKEMRKAFDIAVQEKNAEIRQFHEDYRKERKELEAAHRNEVQECQQALRTVNDQLQKAVMECSTRLQNQSEQHRAEAMQLQERRIEDMAMNAKRMEEKSKEINAMTASFANALIGCTVRYAVSREESRLVESANSFRWALEDVKHQHYNTVDSVQLALADYNCEPAKVHIQLLGDKLTRADFLKLTLMQALNSSQPACERIIRDQMVALNEIELALSAYRESLSYMRVKVYSASLTITQSDIDVLMLAQKKLAEKMLELPLIETSDNMGAITTASRGALAYFGREDIDNGPAVEGGK